MVFRELSKVYQHKIIAPPSIINEEFTQKVIDYNADRLKQTTGRDADIQDIKRYVARFGVLKDTEINELKRSVSIYIRNRTPAFNPNSQQNSTIPFFKENIKKLANTPQDIGLYTWPQLETVVDGFRWPETEEEKRRKEELEKTLKPGYPAPVLYNQGGLVLMFAPTFEYSNAILNWLNKVDAERNPRQGKIGDPYWFCLSVASSTFDSYRSGSNVVRSLYFVYDTKQPLNSNLRVNVIQPQSDGLYLFTEAQNIGTDKTYSWEQMIARNPRLEPLKRYLIVRPLTDEEQEARILSNKVTPETFRTLTKYRYKQKYISSRTENNMPRVIYKQDYLDLPAELQHDYLQVRAMGDMDVLTIVTALTLQLFADTTMDEILKSVQLTDTKIQQDDPKWFIPFINNTTIDQSRRSETKKYYGTLLIRALQQLGQSAQR